MAQVDLYFFNFPSLHLFTIFSFNIALFSVCAVFFRHPIKNRLTGTICLSLFMDFTHNFVGK